MDRSELMRLSVEKAVTEISWESIEFLFRPMIAGELLLRLDFEGTKKLFFKALMDDSPDAMPFRFRGPFRELVYRMIECEKFYRLLKAEATKPVEGGDRLAAC